MVKRGYKQTEVGIIPEDWDVRRIGDFTDAIAGGTPSTNHSEYWNGEILWMSSGELNSRRIYDVTGRITELGYNNSSTHMIPQNCVLVGLAGQGKTRGTVAINFIELCTNQSIAAIFPSSEHNSEYLYQTLWRRYEELRETSSGDGGRGGLNLKLIKNFPCAFPTLYEQEYIAKALSDMDALISNLEKLIAKKKAIKQGAMQELLTGKRRLPGFEGEWKNKAMESYLDFQVGFPFSSEYFNDNSDGLRLVKNRDLKNDDQVYFTTETCSQEYIVEDGDILIGMDGDFMPYIWKKGKALLNQRVGRLIPKENLIGLFAYYALQKPLAELQNGTGATTVKHLSHGDIKKLLVLMPPTKDEQLVIAKILSDMDSEIEKLESDLTKFQMIKQGMMSELLTGRIRLIDKEDA